MCSWLGKPSELRIWKIIQERFALSLKIDFASLPPPVAQSGLTPHHCINVMLTIITVIIVYIMMIMAKFLYNYYSIVLYCYNIIYFIVYSIYCLSIVQSFGVFCLLSSLSCMSFNPMQIHWVKYLNQIPSMCTHTWPIKLILILIIVIAKTHFLTEN